MQAGGNGSNVIYKNGQIFTTFSDNLYGFTITQQPGTYVLQTTQGTCTATDTLKLEYGKTNNLILQSDSYFSSCSRPVQPYYYPTYATSSISNISSSNLKWEKNGGLFSSGSLFVYPNSSGIYQAKYNDPVTGCTGESEKISVTVPPSTERKVFRIITPKKVQLCKNSKANTLIQVSGSYTNANWKKDGKIVGNGNYQINVSDAGKYWYEYNNGQCIVYSDTVEVTTEELPKITLSQTCNKDNTVKLVTTGFSGAKYNWYKDGGIISNVRDTVFTTNQGGKFVVEAFSNTCYSTSNELNVGVSIPESIIICNGDSLKLRPTGNIQQSYSWTGPNGFTSNLPNPFIAKTIKKNQGTYLLQATDNGGCTFKTQTKVLIDDAPAFMLPQTMTVCAGASFALNQYVTVLPLTDTSETVGRYTIVAPNKSTYGGLFSLSSVASKDAGIYNLTAASSQGSCTVKKSFEVIVNASPDCKSVSLISNNSVNVCQGQTLEIPFKITGVFKTDAVFRAYYNEISNTTDGVKSKKVVLGTATKSPIKITIPDVNGKGYSIAVESEEGISSPSMMYAYTSYVNNNNVIDIEGYGRSSECSSLRLGLNYSYSYTNMQWFLNGSALEKQNSSTLTATKTGTYTFKAKEAKTECDVSFSKDFTIGKIDKPQINSYSNPKELSCFNESVYMYASGSSNATYTWRRNGILQTGNSSSINAVSAGKYTLEITKETCKASSDTLVITQNNNTKGNLKINAYSNNQNKELSTYIYPYLQEGGAFNGLYKLYKDNQLYAEGTGRDVLIKEKGKYFFKVSKGNCEAVSDVFDFNGQVVKLDTILYERSLYPNGEYDYLGKKIQLCDTTAIRYFYGYANDHSTTVVKRKLTAYKDGKVLPAYNANAPVYPSLRYFLNESTFYIYYRGQGNYYATEEITYSDSSKYKYNYGKIDVSISNIINLGTQYNIQTCTDSVSIYGRSYSDRQRPILYTWKKDGVVIKKTAEADYATSLVVKQSGNYVLETTYKGGCMATSGVNKVVLNKMLISSDTTARSLCEGSSVLLYGSYPNGAINDTNKVSYQWFRDGKAITEANGKVSPNSSIPNFTASQAGTYTLKAQQGKCEGLSPNINVKIGTVPNSINYADSVRFCQTQTVDLKTTDNSTLSYLWERDGDFLKDANKATLNIKEAGIYRALNRQGACWNYTPKVKASVLANILPTAVISGTKDINYADTAKVSIAFTSHAPWTFKLSDGKEYTATKSPFELSLKPQFTTEYKIIELKNLCGVGTFSGEANIKVLILSSELEEGVNLNVFPVPTQEDLTIQLSTDKPEKMAWRLVNVTGGILQSDASVTRNTKHEASVSMKNFPEGTYFLHIQAGEKSLTRKIIKKN